MRDLGPASAAHSLTVSPATLRRILMRRTGVRFSRATLYRWLENGLVLSYRLGSRIWIPYAELERLIDEARLGRKPSSVEAELVKLRSGNLSIRFSAASLYRWLENGLVLSCRLGQLGIWILNPCAGLERLIDEAGLGRKAGSLK